MANQTLRLKRKTERSKTREGAARCRRTMRTLGDAVSAGWNLIWQLGEPDRHVP